MSRTAERLKSWNSFFGRPAFMHASTHHLLIVVSGTGPPRKWKTKTWMEDTSLGFLYSRTAHRRSIRAQRFSSRGRTRPSPFFESGRRISRARRSTYSQRRRSEEHTSELQSRPYLVCRLL